jgi:hypothetical protein
VAWQHSAGGWRYAPRTPGDMSVSGWFIQALCAGRAAELLVPNATWSGASDFLDSMANSDGSGYGYQQAQTAPTMTAVGLYCRSQLRKDFGPEEGLEKGKQYLTKLPPSPSFKNMYYYYHATKVMNLYEDGRSAWNQKMHGLLIPQQDWSDPATAHQKGSWNPSGDAWGGQLGRLGMTSFALMALQASAPPKEADGD